MRYILKEFRCHKWRTLVCISGYSIATFFILIVLSLTSSTKTDSIGILQSTGTHFIVYIPTNNSCCSNSSSKGSIFAEGVNTLMLDHEMIYTIRSIEGIRDAAPYLLFKMYHESYKTDISIGGIDTSSLATRNNVCAATNLIAGNYISSDPNELVAEESFAVAHNLSLGDSMDLFGCKMKLVGIINSGIKPAKADFYAPIENVRTLLKDKLQCKSTGFYMNIILVEVANARNQEKVISQIKKSMYKFSVSSYNCYKPASKVMSIIEKMSSFLTIIIFAFLIIFSTKSQLTSLMERFREIGILKSLGWSDFKLSSHIIIISLIQSLIGVLIGLFLGAITIIILNYFDIRLFNMMEFQIQYATIPLLFILALTGGIFACIFPIIKIYRTMAGEIINNYL